jgi:hypothetical protein
VAFDGQKKLYIQGFNYETEERTQLRNWYMCDTNYGYRYNELLWAVGEDPEGGGYG